MHAGLKRSAFAMSQGFKATPSLAAVEERFKAFGECELDATAPGCDGAV